MHADILTSEEVSSFKRLDIYISVKERPMLPAAWVTEMFHLATRRCEEALRALEAQFEDVVTFRGHPYLRIMEEQTALIMKKGGLGAVAPVTYVGNPFLRRTGTLLIAP